MLALTYKGAIFGWGLNRYAQLGVDPNAQAIIEVPQLINTNLKVKMNKIFAGKYHSMSIGKDDVLYYWGSV